MDLRSNRISLAVCAGLLTATMQPAAAVEMHDLKGLEQIFGRYAPGGDCTRQPRILVDVTGLAFEMDGKKEKVTNPEYAASYGSDSYSGISIWIFPYRSNDGYPILMTFNAEEKKGRLLIEGHDEGWQGGPKLGPRNATLVKGSPYALCKT